MSIRIKAGKKVISFTGDNAVLCELKDGYEGTVLQDSYPFIDDDEGHDNDNHNNCTVS